MKENGDRKYCKRLSMDTGRERYGPFACCAWLELGNVNSSRQDRSIAMQLAVSKQAGMALGGGGC